MKVIWTLASGKAFDRPTSFGRLRWAGASTLIGTGVCYCGRRPMLTCRLARTHYRVYYSSVFSN